MSASFIAAEAAAAGAGHLVNLLLLTDTSVAAAGGSERFLRNLVSLLSPDTYRITLVQLTDGDDAGADGEPLFDVGHVALVKMSVGAVYGTRGWQAWRRLRRLLRSQRFDIVQSHHEKSDVLNALLPRHAGGARISNRRDMGFNKSPRLKLLFRLLNRRFDCIVAPSAPIIDGLAHSERLRHARTMTIPNGVDAARFAPGDAAARAAVRASLGLAVDDIACVCVASLTPVKCHDDLVQGFAQAQRGEPRLRLLLVGDGPLRARVEAQVDALGLGDRVTLLGDRRDIEALLPAMDLGVLVSSTEGMSNAVLEMMACGLPVVASAVGGNPQLVAHGDSGLLVPARDPDALAQALLALAGDPARRATMAASARARIESDYSLATMARAFERLYGQLLARP